MTRARKKMNSVSIDMLPDDLVRNVIFRLPHARHVHRCLAVCKRWRSLISEESFPARWRNERLESCLAYTLVFVVPSYLRFYAVFSKESRTIHSTALSSSSYLDFASPKSFRAAVQMELLGSYEGWLLFFDRDGKDGGRLYDRYTVCDPVTQSRVRVPRPPLSTDKISWGLTYASVPRGGFIVVRLLLGGLRPQFEGNDRIFNANLFYSKRRKWVLTKIRCRIDFGPRFNLLYKRSLTTESGVMHFRLLAEFDLVGFFAFRPSDSSSPKRGTFIVLPPGIDTTVPTLWGLLNGRLRLAQSDYRKGSYILKIWDLIYEDDSDIESSYWVMVYVGLLGSLEGGANNLCVKAIHPHKGSAVFVVNNCNAVYEYDFNEEKYTFISKILFGPYPKVSKGQISSSMLAYTLLHPSEPLPIDRV